MRLENYLKKIQEEGTVTTAVAEYPERLPFTTKRQPFLKSFNKKKKKKEIIPT